jgi:hypothetical protein
MCPNGMGSAGLPLAGLISPIAVAIEIREERAESVLEVDDFQSRGLSDLPKGDAARGGEAVALAIEREA